MLAVARTSDQGEPKSLEQVSRQTGKSKRYLEQIALGLKRANLLRAVSGRRGGYFLSRPADQITLREVIEATIGEINIVDCVEKPAECSKSDDCEFRALYSFINKTIIEIFEKYTLDDLASESLPSELQGSVTGGSAACPHSP